MNTAVTVFMLFQNFICVHTASVSSTTFLMVVAQLVCVCLEHIICKIMDLSIWNFVTFSNCLYVCKFILLMCCMLVCQ